MKNPDKKKERKLNLWYLQQYSQLSSHFCECALDRITDTHASRLTPHARIDEALQAVRTNEVPQAITQRTNSPLTTHHSHEVSW